MPNYDCFLQLRLQMTKFLVATTPDVKNFLLLRLQMTKFLVAPTQDVRVFSSSVSR